MSDTKGAGLQETPQGAETHRHLIRERTRELIARAELLRQLEPARRPDARPLRGASERAEGCR